MVVQEDLAEFTDAVFQAMFLGTGNGITSILSRVRVGLPWSYARKGRSHLSD